ncbi:ETC complex I subunit conserved region-domain-containing protein [Mycotypha africana]|uniref:ETC complex I subunit conserved region-domain-containing protein n=1 Tax=Mycotypha africana TaxID=64632 RepID=UPI002301DE7A|nr:ETC complex I subunit conserved region-domain-containing protein [Mycotypha africana]KAI8992060.1 ETC complex I subunit conserved region-domain-containing protein [Mycotypha africana]
MRFTRTLFQAVTKPSTGIAGLKVHRNPRPHLIQTYNSTLEVCSRLPTTAVYRQTTEAITKHRLAVVESTENIEEIETKINVGQIEEIIEQAEDELGLAKKVEEWKPWEPLEVPIPPGQWVYPKKE